MNPPGPTVHILEVTLLDVTPRVWRTIRVPSAFTLSVLHTIFQLAVGWEDRHLHEWRVGDELYASADEEDWGEEAGDETAATLSDVAPPGSVLRYAYDLGDGWEHLVEVVAVEPYTGSVPPIEILDGARSAPPEDCGGPGGYEHLLDALRDPDDPEHEEMLEAYGDTLDPDWFDRPLLNRRLEALWRYR